MPRTVADRPVTRASYIYIGMYDLCIMSAREAADADRNISVGSRIRLHQSRPSAGRSAIARIRRTTQDRAGPGRQTATASGNYDEEVFENPFDFNTLRNPNPHLGFGGNGAVNPTVCATAGSMASKTSRTRRGKINQVATDTAGTDHEIYGIGGSWFGYAGDGKWAWQRDFFDFGHVTELYLALLKSGNVTKEFSQRVAKNASGQRLPGWYPRGAAPQPIWPPDTSHGSPA